MNPTVAPFDPIPLDLALFQNRLNTLCVRARIGAAALRLSSDQMAKEVEGDLETMMSMAGEIAEGREAAKLLADLMQSAGARLMSMIEAKRAPPKPPRKRRGKSGAIMTAAEQDQD